MFIIPYLNYLIYILICLCIIYTIIRYNRVCFFLTSYTTRILFHCWNLHLQYIHDYDTRIYAISNTYSHIVWLCKFTKNSKTRLLILTIYANYLINYLSIRIIVNYVMWYYTHYVRCISSTHIYLQICKQCIYTWYVNEVKKRLIVQKHN